MNTSPAAPTALVDRACGPIQRDLRVMGGRAHIVVHGGTEAMADRAVARLAELEGLWSRFRGDSDITRANLAGGFPTEVHEDTLAIVSRALVAWRQTAGRFDITMLPALLDAGYTNSVVHGDVAPSLPGRRVGLSALVMVDYDTSTITVPATGAIDLGGIGKGFAADIVAEELIEQGATGALVNLGGDLVALGTPSDDGSWYLGIEDPRDPPHHVATLRFGSGAIATSGTTVRCWTTADGGTAHHLIDPATGSPSAHGIATATVVAADGATAESFATAAMMLPAPEAVAMLDRVGLAGLVITTAGDALRTSTLEGFSA